MGDQKRHKFLPGHDNVLDDRGDSNIHVDDQSQISRFPHVPNPQSELDSSISDEKIEASLLQYKDQSSLYYDNLTENEKKKILSRLKSE